jgi:hypothetical protein
MEGPCFAFALTSISAIRLAAVATSAFLIVKLLVRKQAVVHVKSVLIVYCV